MQAPAKRTKVSQCDWNEVFEALYHQILCFAGKNDIRSFAITKALHFCSLEMLVPRVNVHTDEFNQMSASLHRFITTAALDGQKILDAMHAAVFSPTYLSVETRSAVSVPDSVGVLKIEHFDDADGVVQLAPTSQVETCVLLPTRTPRVAPLPLPKHIKRLVVDLSSAVHPHEARLLYLHGTLDEFRARATRWITDSVKCLRLDIKRDQSTWERPITTFFPDVYAVHFVHNIIGRAFPRVHLVGADCRSRAQWQQLSSIPPTAHMLVVKGHMPPTCFHLIPPTIKTLVFDGRVRAMEVEFRHCPRNVTAVVVLGNVTTFESAHVLSGVPFVSFKTLTPSAIRFLKHACYK